MKLFDLFNRNSQTLTEGGNVSSASPGWQGAADQEAEEIDLKIHDRDFMVGQLRTLLAAQNESFKAAYGRYIWDPKLLKSGQMFSGSSLTFFDVKGVSTQDFMNKLKKTKVGDIDTQIDQDMGDEVTEWLKSIIGQKVGNGTFLGFNSSLSSLWLLDDPPVRVQIDYELGPYDPKTKTPTEWFAYSHSSHYDDMAAGIKGVFHKYLNRAMTHAQATTKYVARVLKKGVKISDEPVTDSDYSFAVSSAQGGGMSKKYKPYIDPNTGEPMMKDGIPVMQEVPSKDRDYIQNLDQQFQINFGRKRTAADKNLQASFVGTIQLMNKMFTSEQNEAVARAFLDILFGPGAQMITKDDPERDRDIKFAAVDAMLLGGNGIKPLNLPNGKALRQEAVQMAMDYADKFRAKKAGKGGQTDTEVAEDAEAAAAARPNYARQGIKHLYNRLPDGRVSTTEMKDAEFLEVAKEIAANGGTLNGFPINLKVDGAGIRFGKDEAGRPFFMTSKVTTPLYQDDVGYFTNFGQQRGQDAEQLARTKNYDDALAIITGSKFIQALPADTIVQAEMLYNPMAEKTDQGLKFVNIPYDPKRLGKQMTLIPFAFKQYSTGDELENADRIKKRLLAASDSNIKIISNSLEQKGINVSKIINPILDLDPKDKANKPAFDKAKQELSDTIINNPKLAGKDALGDNMEGIVVNLPNGRLFKVTSSQMKIAMAAKMATPAAKREGAPKTAVVAIGSFAGHRGHEELFNFTINKAKELGGDPYLFIGNAVGVDDPIPPEIKVQTWHKLYPQYAKNISYVMQGGSLMQKIKHELINPQPGKPPKYDNIIIMVGEDRKDMPLAGALMKAVNKFPGYEHVKASLEVTPRGTGMSFTKLRNILKDPNATPEQQYALWAQGFDEKRLGKDWILHLMDVSRQGMGIATQPADKPVAETRLFNSLVRPSLIKEEAAGVGVIASKKQAKDPRYSTSLTQDVRPGQVKKNLSAFSLEETQMSADEYKQHLLKTLPDMLQFLSRTVKGWKPSKEELLAAVETGYNVMKRTGDVQQAGKAVMDELNTLHRMSQGQGIQEASLDEIGYSDQLGDLTVPHNKVIAGASQDGTISQKPVMKYEQGNSTLFFFADDATISALILIADGNKLRAIKNFTGQPGQVFALLNYVVNMANIRLTITADEPLTKEGFNWVAKLINNPAGLKITDLEGNPINTKQLKDEWLKSKSSQGTESGDTGIVISESSQRWKTKLKENESRLIPHLYFDVSNRKKKIANEGDSKAIAHTAKSLENPPKVMQHRAKRDMDREKELKYRDIAKRDDMQDEAMLPKSTFAGSDKNKLGPAAHLKGKMKRPARQGDLVGSMEEEKSLSNSNPCWKGYKPVGTKKKAGKTVPNCVPVSEDVEKIMSLLIERIVTNETVSNNKRKS